jgi:hypothetical protein
LTKRQFSAIYLLNAQTGYRDGITAGKESALQEGFDDGFASVGAPLGRELGILRGISSAILSFLTSSSTSPQDHNTTEQESLAEARDIAVALANIRFTDIAPRDLDAEEHARQHLESEDADMEVKEELSEKRDLERIEDMLAKLTAGTSAGAHDKGRPNSDDVQKLYGRLKTLSEQLDLETNWS